MKNSKFRGSTGNQKQGKSGCARVPNRYHSLSNAEYEGCFPSLGGVKSRTQFQKESVAEAFFSLKEEDELCQDWVVKALSKAKEGRSPLSKEELGIVVDWLANIRGFDAGEITDWISSPLATKTKGNIASSPLVVLDLDEQSFYFLGKVTYDLDELGILPPLFRRTKPSYVVLAKKENAVSNEDALPSSGGSSPFLSRGPEYVDRAKIKEAPTWSGNKVCEGLHTNGDGEAGITFSEVEAESGSLVTAITVTGAAIFEGEKVSDVGLDSGIGEDDVGSDLDDGSYSKDGPVNEARGIAEAGVSILVSEVRSSDFGFLKSDFTKVDNAGCPVSDALEVENVLTIKGNPTGQIRGNSKVAAQVLDESPEPNLKAAEGPFDGVKATCLDRAVNANIHATKVLEFMPLLNSEINLPSGGAKSDPGAVKLGDDLYTELLEGDGKEQDSDYGILNVHEGLIEGALRELNDRPHAEALPSRTWANVVGGFHGVPRLNQRSTSSAKLEYFAPDGSGVIDIDNDMVDDQSWDSCL
ncbi:hypothetical protein U1Q18_031304, partial [Sarracenia purpurea var. burkii]